MGLLWFMSVKLLCGDGDHDSFTTSVVTAGSCLVLPASTAECTRIRVHGVHDASDNDTARVGGTPWQHIKSEARGIAPCSSLIVEFWPLSDVCPTVNMALPVL